MEKKRVRVSQQPFRVWHTRWRKKNTSYGAGGKVVAQGEWENRMEKQKGSPFRRENRLASATRSTRFTELMREQRQAQ